MESFKVRLTDFLDASYPILAVETHEESRVLADIRSVVYENRFPKPKGKKDSETRVPYYEWAPVVGMYQYTWNPKTVIPVNGSVPPPDALKLVNGVDERAVVVFKDLHPFMENPAIWRSLKELIPSCKSKPVTIILVSSRFKMPPELVKEVQIVEYALPTRDEIKVQFVNYVDDTIKGKDEYKDLSLTDEMVDAVAEAAMGMTNTEIENAFSLATIASKRRRGRVVLDVQYHRDIFENKIINLKSSALEYVPTQAGFDSVGGLDVVKEWALRRRSGFSDRARGLCLPYPKGVLLAGIKGTGKTTTAMAIAHQFGFPLFKFDVSKLFASKVGESEANTREAIRTIESLGRCVLLLDEMEKFFSSNATSGGGDSGTSSRMFGTLVSWMSLKNCPAFIVGTLNNFETLPSELMRKGRFDEVFWCDLPSDQERLAIFHVLLRTKFKVKDVDLSDVSDELVEKTKEFSGAEIEAVIEESMYETMHTPSKNLPDILLSMADTIIPQARIDPDQVAELRRKAKAFKPASSASPKSTQSKKRTIQLN